jgi:arabinogalactan oligomer/maltooligosaccharide transport system permease protein
MTRKALILDRPGSRPRVVPESPARGWAFVVKVALMALVDALGVYLVLKFVANDQTVIAGAVAIALVVINIVYFRAGNLPAKYIIPGLIFLLVFQVFVICFSVFVSFTNYGSGHNIEKPAAVEAIQANSVARVPGSQAYPVTVLEKNNELYLLATSPDGQALWPRPRMLSLLAVRQRVSPATER